jgi:diphosphomevalonate decarboxylase
MNLKKNTVDKILAGKNRLPQQERGEAFAPSNIALCKYWGKRDNQLNLPVTNSLSIGLNNKGAKTTISVIEGPEDCVIVNKQAVPQDAHFAQALKVYLDLFRAGPDTHFRIETEVNIPIAAGLASSACGFAAVIRALNNLYNWELEDTMLSVLARLGSGSASRSLWHGFVEWQRGECAEGLDSHGVPLATKWPEFRIGLVILESAQKKQSSRHAMENTVRTSPFYKAWPSVVSEDLGIAKRAILDHDFRTLGAVSEANALAMHALMLTARPSIMYTTEQTLKFQNQVWTARDAGLSLYFTQDAGPNLKLLFLEKELDAVMTLFPTMEIVSPFVNLEDMERAYV